MTTVQTLATPPSWTAELRTLAGIEAWRYARHPLFLAGAGCLVVTLAFSDLDSTAIGDITVVPAFLLGLLGVLVGFRLTRSMVSAREPVAASPTDGVLRTAALCVACLVPGVTALACYLWMDGWLVPQSPGFSASERSAILLEGVVYAVGGPLVGVMVGRWTRFPGAGVLAAVALVGWTLPATISEAMAASRLTTLVHLNAPFAFWVGGPRDDHPWVTAGSPQWYLVYLTLLCGVAVTAAMLHEANGQQRSRMLRLLVILAVFALVSLGLAVAPNPTRIPL